MKPLEQITLKHFMERNEHYTHKVCMMKKLLPTRSLLGWDLGHLISRFKILLNGITDNPPPDLSMVIKRTFFVLQADSKDWFPMVRNPQHFF